MEFKKSVIEEIVESNKKILYVSPGRPKIIIIIDKRTGKETNFGKHQYEIK